MMMIRLIVAVIELKRWLIEKKMRKMRKLYEVFLNFLEIASVLTVIFWYALISIFVCLFELFGSWNWLLGCKLMLGFFNYCIWKLKFAIFCVIRTISLVTCKQVCEVSYVFRSFHYQYVAVVSTCLWKWIVYYHSLYYMTIFRYFGIIFVFFIFLDYMHITY